MRALRGVDLDVGAGEFVAIMGPSGCGKSTLLNLVAGLDIADDGEIVLAGEPITGGSEDELARMRRRHIGIVFQFFNLLEGMTRARERRAPGDDRRARSASRPRPGPATCSTCSAWATRPATCPAVLSGGQRQRLAIARALANEPTLLLADEPTGALDTDGGHEVLELFRRLHADGQTILMVTHDDEVAAAADRIVRMRDGRVEARASPNRRRRHRLVGRVVIGTCASGDGVTTSRTLDAVETVQHPAERAVVLDPTPGPLLPFAAPAFVVGVAAAGAASGVADVTAPTPVRYAATGVMVVWALVGLLTGCAPALRAARAWSSPRTRRCARRRCCAVRDDRGHRPAAGCAIVAHRAADRGGLPPRAVPARGRLGSQRPARGAGRSGTSRRSSSGSPRAGDRPGSRRGGRGSGGGRGSSRPVRANRCRTAGAGEPARLQWFGGGVVVAADRAGRRGPASARGLAACARRGRLAATVLVPSRSLVVVPVGGAHRPAAGATIVVAGL